MRNKYTYIRLMLWTMFSLLTLAFWGAFAAVVVQYLLTH